MTNRLQRAISACVQDSCVDASAPPPPGWQKGAEKKRRAGRSEQEVEALIEAVRHCTISHSGILCEGAQFAKAPSPQIREHTKFRQLACYSIEALSKVLAPPNSRWREYIEIAIDHEAARAIVAVIKKHPGNEDVLAVATKCLARLAVNAANATLITEEGGVEVTSPYLCFTTFDRVPIHSSSN